MDVGEKGVRFEDVVRQIKRYYIKRGYSPERAEEIARKTAGKIFWRKFGKRQGAAIISRARRKRR
ncbi:MAG: hypothetical protein DRN81_04120 [Thermoproteota archaeon]|nr:MAG: hypothetical protein DRN81_04120 [Candidatus Korarchaeota archaeon]